jgi:hypothetical protein
MLCFLSSAGQMGHHHLSAIGLIQRDKQGAQCRKHTTRAVVF